MLETGEFEEEILEVYPSCADNYLLYVMNLVLYKGAQFQVASLGILVFCPGAVE